MVDTELIDVVVGSVVREALDTNSYELRPLDTAQSLPAFTAGAHIELHLPNGLPRAYSLVNSQDERDRYVVAVTKDANSRGGSRYMHESLKVGDRLQISAPRNNFPLNEDAEHTVLIAGGIGITPLWCMAKRLHQLGKSWELHYCARTSAHAAFFAELSERKADGMAIRFNFDGEPGGKMLDLGALIAASAPNAHFYCCGPTPMLAAYEAAASTRADETVHIEYFKAKEQPDAKGGFTVVLAKSGKELFVHEGKTILDTMLEDGVDAPYSCMEGTCGVCETKVLSGIPEHRDVFFTKAEHALNNKIAICCSGSKSERLVLDL